MYTKTGKLAGAGFLPDAPAMDEEQTTTIIQRYLDALPGDATAEPAVRDLLARAVGLAATRQRRTTRSHLKED